MKTVDEILDGWFGTSLSDAENEDELRKYLYEPLRQLESNPTIQGLKTTIERLEEACVRKDERIKQLEKREEYLEGRVAHLEYIESQDRGSVDW